MTKTRKISLVVPVLNEQDSIVPFLARVSEELQALAVDFSVVFVDDGSSDATYSNIQKLAESDHRVQGISLSRNFGKEAAICSGLEAAQGDAVIVMDADLQHPPEILPQMIDQWVNHGFKVVAARKQHRGKESWVNKTGSRLFSSIMTRSTGFNLNGATDYRLLDRQVLNEWKKLPETITFFRGMSSWLGFPTATVDFSVPEREQGSSRWSLMRLVKLAVNAITSFSSLPLHVVTVVGVLLMGFSIILGLHTLYVYLSGQSVGGFTTVILLLLIIGSTLSMGIGVVGLYVSRIYEELKSRPRYIVEKSINLESATEKKQREPE